MLQEAQQSIEAATSERDKLEADQARAAELQKEIEALKGSTESDLQEAEREFAAAKEQRDAAAATRSCDCTEGSCRASRTALPPRCSLVRWCQ